MNKHLPVDADPPAPTMNPPLKGVLSIIIPVYNEKATIEQVISIVESVPVDKEIIIIDDGSTDGTRDILKSASMKNRGLRVMFHEQNQGKGAAVQTGICAAQGDFVIIQDADLEYDPQDYRLLMNAMKKEEVNVVYGSRFLGGKKVTSFWHRAVNGFLTWLTNALYGSRLTDMETCYKMFRREVIQKISLKSRGFEIEPEITAKILKMGERIVEVPVSYKGRSYHEGKKIGWKDGLKAIRSLWVHRR